jgi:hydrogenase maturation protease
VAETLLLGLGNILLRDEGVGVRAVERLLERYDFPEEVLVMDGGTLGLDLLPYVEDASRLLVLDAVQASQPPGALFRLSGNQIPAFLDTSKVSCHQEGLPDLLAVARLKGCLPAEVVLLGVQIESHDVGMEFTPAVAESVELLVRAALEELATWRIQVRPKGTKASREPLGRAGKQRSHGGPTAGGGASGAVGPEGLSA